MDIGVITPGFSAHESDWAIPVLQDLIRHLAVKHSVRVFCLRYPPTRRIYTLAGAQVVALGGADRRGYRKLPLLLGAIQSVVQAHRARPFDLLHAFWADESGFVAGMAGELLTVPRVVSVMGGELVGFPDLGYGGHLSRLNRILTGFSLPRAQRVTTGSAFLADLLQDRYPAVRPLALPMGLDERWFRPHTHEAAFPGFDDKTTRVLSVASLTPVKDLHLLLKAFSLATGERADVQLHLVGKGPLRRDLERFAHKLGLENRVFFHGRVAHLEMPAWYRAADLLVVSSRYESQCMAALEAAASGLPLVGTRVGILPELAGALTPTPTGQPLALAEALAKLLSDPELRERLGREAEKQAQNQFRLTVTVEELERLYRALIS